MIVPLLREPRAPRLWRPVTPAMAAGLTAHGWTTEERLASQVPVAFLAPQRTSAPLFPAQPGVHHGHCGPLPCMLEWASWRGRRDCAAAHAPICFPIAMPTSVEV